MNHIEKDFVPYQESLELKELGFDEPCFGLFIYGNLNLIFTDKQFSDKVISAPLYQQAFRWFREKKVLGLINPIDDWNSWTFSILAEDCMSPFFEMIKGDEYKSYEEAELACLRKLIEIIKEDKKI